MLEKFLAIFRKILLTKMFSLIVPASKKIGTPPFQGKENEFFGWVYFNLYTPFWF